MPESQPDSHVATFHASGRGVGVLALLMVAGALVFGAVASDAHYAAWVWPALALIAVVVWCVILRPCIRLAPTALELRNALSTVQVQLGAVETIEVRQVARVRVGGRTLTCAGAGRTRKVIRRDTQLSGDAPVQDYSDGALLEQRVRHRAAELVELGEATDPTIRRTWAWPEIAALVVTVAATVVAALA